MQQQQRRRRRRRRIIGRLRTTHVGECIFSAAPHLMLRMRGSTYNTEAVADRVHPRQGSGRRMDSISSNVYGQRRPVARSRPASRRSRLYNRRVDDCSQDSMAPRVIFPIHQPLKPNYKATEDRLRRFRRHGTLEKQFPTPMSIRHHRQWRRWFRLQQ